MKKIILLFTACVLFTCNSDDDSGQQPCTEEFVFGLSVTVKDANTNSILTDGLTVIARDDSYEEQLMQIENTDYFLGAGEREGTYIIEISSNNYQMFTSNPILVEKTEDDCHVIPKVLEFQLQPN